MDEIVKIHQKDGRNVVSARELHQFLESKRDFSNWIKDRIEKYGLIENQDYTSFNKIVERGTGGTTRIEYALTIDAAKELAMVEGNDKGRQARQYFIKIANKHETGQAFTVTQINTLIDITKSMTLVSVQKDAERLHFYHHDNRLDWWEHRAEVTGVSVDQLKDAMMKVNKKHSSIRKSLMALDPHELIRVGVIDLMIALGKTEEFANNVANLCKSMSEKINLNSDFWDDTKPDQLGINKHHVNTRQQLYISSTNRNSTKPISI